MEDETYPLLTAVDVRVLGCLLEKAATTADAYPLSLNSLQLACNQKSNRHPVVDYDEATILESIDDLRKAKLAFRVDVAGSRVAKYRHNLDELNGLGPAGKALLTVLLLAAPKRSASYVPAVSACTFSPRPMRWNWPCKRSPLWSSARCG